MKHVIALLVEGCVLAGISEVNGVVVGVLWLAFAVERLHAIVVSRGTQSLNQLAVLVEVCRSVPRNVD